MAARSFNPGFAQSAEDLIRGRRSKRAFLPDPVPKEVLTKIFELANHAPSGSNTQARRVVVVSGRTKERLSKALVVAAMADKMSVDFPFRQEAFQGAYLERMKKVGAEMYGAWGIEKDDDEGRRKVYLDNLRFYGAPHAAFLFVPDFLVERNLNDIGIYGQTLMLAMHGYGADSCPQGSLGFYADTAREFLGISSEYRLMWGISFGYADPSAPINGIHALKSPISETVELRD